LHVVMCLCMNMLMHASMMLLLYTGGVTDVRDSEVKHDCMGLPGCV